ncbi:ROK family protein [Bacillus sp. OK048]|nr:ROK family protein [Bacillus sp. OK048]
MEEAAKIIPSDVAEQDLTIEMLIELAKNGNDDVIRLFNNIGEYLGVGINNIIHSFNPEQIIIGSRLIMAKDWIENPIKRFVKRHTMEYHQKGLTISFSELNTHAAAIGVSAISIEGFLKNAVQ